VFRLRLIFTTRLERHSLERMFPNDNKTGFCTVIPGAYGAVELTETSHNIYKSLFTIQYGRNDNEKNKQKTFTANYYTL